MKISAVLYASLVSIIFLPPSRVEVNGNRLRQSLGDQVESKGAEEEGQVQGGSAQGEKKIEIFFKTCFGGLFAFLIFLQVFPNELESQPEFEGFSEWLQTFDLYRGKKSEEEFEDENRIVGKFKVNLLNFYL